MVVVMLEIEELHLQIRGRPEQGAVQTFAPNGANQPFNEGMGERHVRHGLDFPDVEDAQIRLPLAEPIQGIMVRAEIFRRGLASSRSIKHSGQPQVGFRRFMSTTAAMTSSVGPFGPGFVGTVDEKSRDIFAVSALDEGSTALRV